jgi:hypothetical protein
MKIGSQMRSKVIHQQVVHHPIAEIGGEDLAPGRVAKKQTERPGRYVRVTNASCSACA